MLEQEKVLMKSKLENITLSAQTNFNNEVTGQSQISSFDKEQSLVGLKKKQDDVFEYYTGIFDKIKL